MRAYALAHMLAVQAVVAGPKPPPTCGPITGIAASMGACTPPPPPTKGCGLNGVVMGSVVGLCSPAPKKSGGGAASDNPKSSIIPGIGLFQNVAGTVLMFALIACVAGIGIWGATWAIGNYNTDPATAARGKLGVVVSATAAVLVGGAAALVTYFTGAGSKSFPL